LDVTPLYKYDLRGRDAARLLSRMTVRDAGRLEVGRVAYGCWCDDDGKVVDDGTVSRLGEEHYRLTAADPTLHWLQRLARGLTVEIEDTTHRLAALAVQGPTSRDVLAACSDADLSALGFFRVTRCRVGGLDAWISRTGFTGDLGYEVWVESGDALPLWDALTAAGRPWGLTPVGLDALDISRIEAGFVLLGVDYYSAPKEVLESRKSTPFELGFDWMVSLEREPPPVGHAALAAEKARGPAWRLVGLEVSWEELETLYDSYGLPPSLPAEASREALPVYRGKAGRGGEQVGRVTSHTWSPTLKKSIALASVRAEHAAPGTRLAVEHTVEWSRHTVTATVVSTPFFNPERKRS
jgi:aminomethyltransferase